MFHKIFKFSQNFNYLSTIKKFNSNKLGKIDSKNNTFNRFKAIMDVPDGIFKGVTDRFDGVTIDLIQEHNNNENFAEKLEKSLSFWKDRNFRGVWFKIYLENSDCIPVLAKKGFNFHHAHAKGYLMMYKWLPTEESENIPVFAHTMVGVGGLVVNDKNEILAVSDKHGMIPGSWKLPGGYVEPKENFVNAAIREVKEETGISSEFDTLISVRHSHGGNFGCSDIYIVMALKPTTCDIKRCEREIAKVEWIPIEEFLKNPKVHETNRKFVKSFQLYKENGIKINCEEDIHQILKKKYCLYSVKVNPKEKE